MIILYCWWIPLCAVQYSHICWFDFAPKLPHHNNSPEMNGSDKAGGTCESGNQGFVKFWGSISPSSSSSCQSQDFPCNESAFVHWASNGAKMGQFWREEIINQVTTDTFQRGHHQVPSGGYRAASSLTSSISEHWVWCFLGCTNQHLIATKSRN